jgi:hypothetical protein
MELKAGRRAIRGECGRQGYPSRISNIERGNQEKENNRSAQKNDARNASNIGSSRVLCAGYL